jgi:tripartite-type tricarboxylate transporter receptor subunit TctC
MGAAMMRLLVALLACCAVPSLAHADAVADFYLGKTIRVIVAGGAGASLGLYSRVFSDGIGKYIPGNPTLVPDFRGGAGGTLAAAFMANAAPHDGTHIGLILPPTVYAPLLTPQKYDAATFVWIGSMTPRPAVVSVLDFAPAKTLADAKRTEVVVGSSGRNSETYLIPAFMNAFLGTRFKIVTGYKAGDDINLALERGEVHGRMQYWTGWTTIKQDWLNSGKLIHFVQYGPRIKEIPAVPYLGDLVQGEPRRMFDFLEIAQAIGMGFYFPAGVPGDRVAALRAAFEKFMADPEMRADAARRGMEIELVKGEALQSLVARSLAIEPRLVDKLKDAIGFRNE